MEEIKHDGGMIDFHLKREGERLFKVKLTYWKDEIYMVLKTGSETLRLEEDLKELLERVRKVNIDKGLHDDG